MVPISRQKNIDNENKRYMSLCIFYFENTNIYFKTIIEIIFMFLFLSIQNYFRYIFVSTISIFSVSE